MGYEDLRDKVVIVTGATKGLGRSMAQAFAHQGARVVVTGRDHDTATAAAHDIAERSGAVVRGHACHMGDWHAPDRLVNSVVDELGGVDVLVNNAGINPSFTPLAQTSPALWEKVFAVNARGPMRLACVAAPVMPTGRGSIVNVASVCAYRGVADNGVYAASKAALLSLSRTMAIEWAARGIRVNVVSPGPFRTEKLVEGDRARPGLLKSAGASTLLDRVGEPDEVVGAVMFLASAASSYVTGEDVVVAGGAPV